MKIIFSIFSLFVLTACTIQSEYKNTPKEFINYVVAPDSTIYKDSVFLIKSLQKLITNNEEPYSNQEYTKLSEVIIDTIIYAPGFTKFAFFSVIKNPAENNIYLQSDSTHYYMPWGLLAEGLIATR